MDLPRALLQPFAAQAVALRAIVPAGGRDVAAIAESASLALAPEASGIDLLLAPATLLCETLAAQTSAFAYRAVAVLAQPADSPDVWQAQRRLFDRGLVCIGSVEQGPLGVRCYLASDAVGSLARIEGASRGRLTVETLSENGRFANQLFRYAYARLYALRHGATAQFPPWEGRSLYGLDDPPCAPPALPRLNYAGFSDADFELWERDDPPVDIDLMGYFQERPACWEHHRPLLRRMFELPAAQRQAIECWRARVTREGERTLVAIHVRRGDYRKGALDLSYFRLVPEAWYLDWLRALWPTLRDPVLFVATDEPDTIRPCFREFECVSEPLPPPADALPEHVRDFEILRVADRLAICNSSYSRMAALLAPDAQKCWLPSFETQSFAPYAPWADHAFWRRFHDPRQPSALAAAAEPAAAPAPAGHGATIREAATVHFDVADLVPYLVNHPTLSGIQRVQCEILRHLLDDPDVPALRPVVIGDDGDLLALDAAALVALLDDVAAGASTRPVVVSGLHALVARAVRCAPRPRDIFITVGAFWPVRGMGRLLQRLDNAGVAIGVLIHDLLPVDAPEYFEARATRIFVKGVVEALTFADFVVTTSGYNRSSILRLLAARGLDGVPVEVVALARERAHGAPREGPVSPEVARIIATDYVLCVGTIEVRKNPAYLFNLWKLLCASGREEVPSLVFAGRSGWLVRDFLDQLSACDFLGGGIVLLHDASDAELDLLYRNCLLTVFPSFAEGWGLPVGEALAHGKVCLCSATTGIPDAGGAAADYIDPYNVRDGLRQLTRYLDDPELRLRREREIALRFVPRSWREVSAEFLRSMLELARRASPLEGAAAMRLPAGEYLPVGSDAAAMPRDAMTGALSAELACAEGWQPAAVDGVRSIGPRATLRFRAGADAGTRIVVVLRLAGQGRPSLARIRSGSGATVDASLAVGVERVAAISCDVEAESLVTLSLVADAPGVAERFGFGVRRFELKGILYFEPKRMTAAAMQQMLRGEDGQRPSAPRHLPAPAQRIRLTQSLAMDERRRAASLADFRRSTDSWWPSEGATALEAPLLADDADRRTFASGRVDGPHSALVGRDGVKLVRRSDVFVSMARFTEGSVFDRTGAWRGMGYLQVTDWNRPPWLSADGAGVQVDAGALATAPFIDASCLVFYNGNLHNYYHWLAEGLLGLDVLRRAMGPDAEVRVLLPKSMDVGAAFDHRATLGEAGLGGPDVVEVADDLVRVREAIWVDSDLVQTMPAQHLEAFRRRVLDKYAVTREGAKRRLLVARTGPTRTIANQADVEGLLATRGFETVYLEGRSMAEQIALFRGAQCIVAPHGAGLANLLFCERGTRVIELMPRAEFRPFFWLIAQKLALVHGIAFCETTPGQGFQGALEVDVAKLEALIGLVDAAGDAQAVSRRSA